MLSGDTSSYTRRGCDHTPDNTPIEAAVFPVRRLGMVLQDCVPNGCIDHVLTHTGLMGYEIFIVTTWNRSELANYFQ